MPFHTRRREERGATLVEFALILPVLMALILGMFTGGLAYNRKISMTNAVREGARFGATIPYSTSLAGDVATRVQELSGGEISAGQVCVQVYKKGTGAVISSPAGGCGLSTAAPSDPAATPTGTCLIKVWAARSADLQALFFKTTLNLTSDAVARYERTSCG